MEVVPESTTFERLLVRKFILKVLIYVGILIGTVILIGTNLTF